MESDIFRRIKPHEWLAQSWTKPNKRERAPGIMHMIQRFNDVSSPIISNFVAAYTSVHKVSGWIATEIVTSESMENRVVLVNRFLTIAQVSFLCLPNDHHCIRVMVSDLNFLIEMFGTKQLQRGHGNTCRFGDSSCAEAQADMAESSS